MPPSFLTSTHPPHEKGLSRLLVASITVHYVYIILKGSIMQVDVGTVKKDEILDGAGDEAELIRAIFLCSWEGRNSPEILSAHAKSAVKFECLPGQAFFHRPHLLQDLRARRRIQMLRS